MANTVSLLNYDNTFGDWVVTTNALAQENNNLASNTYHKTAGTLYLDTSTLALQSNGNAVFAQQLAVQGLGSSLFVQNNANVGGQVYLTNTSLSLIASGQSQFLGSGTGLSVANNATIGGTFQVTGTTTLIGNVNLSNNLSVANSIYIGNDISVVDTAYVDILQANSRVNTATVTVTGETVTDTLAANTSVISPLISSTNTTTTGNSFVDILQANTRVNTATLTVTGVGSVNILQANAAVNTATATVTGATLTNTLTANTSINSPIVTVTGTFAGDTAAGTLSSLQVSGQLSVGGNFIISGTTVYDANTFTLSANSSTAITSYYNVNRGSSGANASIRWNETSKYWDILDVGVGGTYSKILTANLMSNSVSAANSTLIATSQAVKTAYDQGVTANVTATAAFVKANTAVNNAASASLYANTAVNNAASASLYANAGITLAQASFNAQNSTAIVANTKFSSSGGTISGSVVITNDLSVSGNLVVSGTKTYVNTSIIQTSDSLIELAANNIVGDVLDIGFYGSSNTGSSVVYHGLVREGSGGTSPGNFLLFKNLTTDPSSGNTINYAGASRATLIADLSGGTVSGLTANIAIADGGTNASSFTSGQIIRYDGTRLVSLPPQTVVAQGLSSANTITSISVDSYGRITTFTNQQIAIAATQVSGLASSATIDTTNASNITTGTIAPTILANSSTYVGTTVISLNRASAAQKLSGVSIDGTASNIEGGASNQIAYQTAANTTAFIVAPTTANTVLTYNGSGFIWNVATSGGSSYDQSLNTTDNVTFANTQLLSLGVGTPASNVAGEIRATGTVTAYYTSDKNLKENIIEIKDAIAKVNQIRGVNFDWTDAEISRRGGEDGYFVRKHDVGVIAQEIEEVLPEIVATTLDGYKAVKYELIVPLLIQAIKELSVRVYELENK